MIRTHFRNRREAGQLLAEALMEYKNQNAVIYALPRGGVVLGYEIAKKLELPLDLVIPRKIGHPMNPEFAVCAVAEDGSLVCSPIGEQYRHKSWFTSLIDKEVAEAKRRRNVYLANRTPIEATGKTAILVDDGIATGLTMKAAIRSILNTSPHKIIVAVPVGPSDTINDLKREVDDVISLIPPENFVGAVGAHYDEFDQVTDEEVIDQLTSLESD